MKIFTCIFLVTCLAFIPKLYAQTVSVEGDASALPYTTSACWCNGSGPFVSHGTGSLTAGFDLIIDSMSVSIQSVSQTSYYSTIESNNSGYAWGLADFYTGFTLIGPNGSTVELIPIYDPNQGYYGTEMSGSCTYSAIANLEIVDFNKFSLLGYQTYSGQLYNLCYANLGKTAIRSENSFAPFTGINARGTWQLQTNVVDNGEFYSNGTWDMWGDPHSVTVNKWALNFRGKYAQAQLSTTQLFASILAPLGRTVQQCITVHNVGGYALTISDTALWSGVAPGEYQIDPNTTFPIVVQPGGSAEVCVDFTPQNIGLRTAQFTL
ncbi:MAG TPA: hypothetical protein VFA55_08915, partial [Candidatus Kapabacteria bacterium]|nr:hypothetical protein [Candidatus Kapabacteria bacterium]